LFKFDFLNHLISSAMHVYRSAILLLTFLLSLHVQGQLVNVVSSPDQVQAETGSTFTLTIRVEPESGAQVSVADVAMAFDPALLQVTSLALSPSSLLTFPTAMPIIDNVEGTLFIGGFSFMATSADFDHVVIGFEAMADGITSVSHVTDGVISTAMAFAGNDVTGTTPSIPVTIGSGTPPDCAGEPGGAAFLDECGTCVGGTTGLEACEADCEGTFGGSATPGSPCTTINDTPGIYTADCACEALPCTASGGTLVAPSNRSFCVGTGSPATISVTANGATGTNQRWGLIDSNGNVVATRSNNSLFNLDLYPPGDYSIRYIRFENDVTNLAGITNISQVNTLVGCYGLASNAINLFLRNEPQGGVLSAVSPTSVCADAGAASVVQVAIAGNSGQNSRFGITSAALGQQIVATNTSGVFNLNGLPSGSYNIGHISFEQGVNVASISFPNELQGCYDLSNFISVSILDCANANLASQPNPTSGPSMVTFNLPATGQATLEVYDMSGRLIRSIFNATAEEGIDYRFNFDGSHLPNGVYLYRLSTTHDVMVEKFMIAR
jgi:hypothetical protein